MALRSQVIGWIETVRYLEHVQCQSTEGFIGSWLKQKRMSSLSGREAGMRVVDVGCGLGDVTLQAARLVGPAGRVIGADVNEDVLTVARQRAEDSGVDNVAFIQAGIPAIPVDGLVDAVIGRLILMHLKDPAVAVRALGALVRPCGIILFQEVDVAYATTRSAPLAAKCTKWCADAAQLAAA
jgi:ubiquinone/menaquinone biosynthesis C-methylase UbiE